MRKRCENERERESDRVRDGLWLPDLRLAPDLAAFRETVQLFLRREMAAGHTDGHRDPTDLTGWDAAFERTVLRRAGDAGLLGVSLPTEYGGGGRPRSWQAVLSFEAAYHDAPLIDTAAALVAPTVLAFGTEAQCDGFVPAAVAGTVNVCIAYTEAGAGSDLSNIATTARADGTGTARRLGARRREGPRDRRAQGRPLRDDRPHRSRLDRAARPLDVPRRPRDTRCYRRTRADGERLDAGDRPFRARARRRRHAARHRR